MGGATLPLLMMKYSKMAVSSMLTIIIVACVGYHWLKRDDSLAELESTGTIRIGYAVEAPYAYVDQWGEVTGTEPEIAKLIAKRLGFTRVQWYQTEFGSLITGLEAGNYDVIAAGMYITPERAKRVAFSNPTAHAVQGLLVAEGNPEEIYSYTDAVHKQGVKIGVLTGSIEERFLEALGMPEERMLCLPDALAGRVAVESGRVDGFAISVPTLRWLEKSGKLGKCEVAMPFKQATLQHEQRPGYSAFAFSLKATRLRKAWNKQLSLFIGSQEHLELNSRFGFEQTELPGAVTVEEILESK